jgi:transposase-like protein
MDDNLYQALGQVSSEDAGQIFRDHLRGCVREMISEVMAAEVSELCGPKHKPDNSHYVRAGSSTGRVLVDGERESVVRPRVRKHTDDGSKEVVLSTYQAARDPSQLKDSIVIALMHGVSTRDVEKLKPDSPGVKKSNVSAHWKSVGHTFVDALRDRDLAATDWVVLMLDGIRLSKDQLAIAAIGIDSSGKKHVLDFELGSSESAEVAKDLMRRLMKRGFHCDRRLYAVLDGSEALRSAVKEFFPDAVVQRCLVHKERNIKSKLSKKHWGELARLFKRLREVEGREAAMEVVEELKIFLKGKSAEALRSLEEAGEDLLALHSLNVPSTLHRSLLSTNAIENSYRNTRNKLGRVTRFRAETDQATRWLSFALLEAEKGFRRISGCDDLPKLMSALTREKDSLAKKSPTGLPAGTRKEVEQVE